MIEIFHLPVFLNGTNDFLNVGKRLKMMKVSVDLRLQEIKETFRKLMKLCGMTEGSLTIRTIAHMANTIKEIVRQILQDELNIIIVSADMVPKLGNNRKGIRSDNNQLRSFAQKYHHM